MILKYREWTFEFDKPTNINTYARVKEGGADSCKCSHCNNYVANRKHIFPQEVLKLFLDLGIDYKKDVEICTWDVNNERKQFLGGWFHFKGKILKNDNHASGESNHACKFSLTQIDENFSIGFHKDNALTFFDEKESLVQVEFETEIPWIIDEDY